MRAGRLRHRITIEGSEPTTDAFGEPIDDWQTFATRWAAVEPLQGQERFTAQQVSAEVSHRVRLRFLEGVKPQMRVVHRGRVLEIEAVIDVEERRREMELLCTEKADV